DAGRLFRGLSALKARKRPKKARKPCFSRREQTVSGTSSPKSKDTVENRLETLLFGNGRRIKEGNRRDVQGKQEQGNNITKNIYNG
ncbi:MAG: hypothetical protein PHC40_01430, partial [Eubacteriales bacterium]|nr:hypothetical protein [Eubacteriales bacterium]